MTAQPLDRAVFDLSSRTKLRATGADRLRFLNGQLTNDVRKTSETSVVEACVLNAKGKMEAHLFLHAHGDSFLFDAGPTLESFLQSRLERYIIADDVQIEDVSDRLSIFHVIGAASPAVPKEARVMSADRFGRSGHDIWIVADRHDQLAAELANRFDFCDADCVEIFRIEQGIPRWGRELTSEIIPIEANLEERCIDYEKGCYIGQETISRMKMSGQRNKKLCGLVSLNDSPLIPGMRLMTTTGDRKDAGWITSATGSERIGKQIALGYVKRGFNSVASRLEAVTVENPLAAGQVEIADLPFAQ